MEERLKTMILDLKIRQNERRTHDVTKRRIMKRANHLTHQQVRSFAVLLLATVRTAAVAAVFMFGLALLLNTLPFWKSATKYVVHIGIILTIWVCARFLDKITLRELGLIPAPQKGFAQFLLGGALAMAGTALLGILMAVTGELSTSHFAALRPVPEQMLGTMLFCILVGFAEELLFRGYLIALSRKHGRLYAGVVVSAIIFSAMHFLNPSYNAAAFAAAFLFGLLYAYMVLMSGNLWMPIGHHIFWNFCQMSFLPEQGGELAALIVMGASFLILHVYFRLSGTGRVAG